MAKPRKRGILWMVLVGVLGLGLAAALVFGRRKPVVVVESVVRGTFERHVEEDGRVRVRERHVVHAPIVGALDRIGLKVGDEVARGAVLATIRPISPALLDPRTRAELEQRHGAVAAELARAKLVAGRAAIAREHAAAEVDRTLTLVAAGTASTAEREHAELELTLARRTQDEAKAAVHLVEHELALAAAALVTTASTAPPVEQFEITSPIDAVVLAIHRESEGPIALGAPVLELADASEVEVVVDLLSTDAVRVDVGASAAILRWGGEGEIAARVRRVEPRAVVKVSALGVEEERVDVVLDPVGEAPRWHRVGDGYRVGVRILVERLDDVLRIPTSALFRERGAWHAFVVEDGRARSREVEVIGYGPLQAAVGGGLSEGESVVAYPGESITEDLRVDTVVE
jgi:HlyD family secretion protein